MTRPAAQRPKASRTPSLFGIPVVWGAGLLLASAVGLLGFQWYEGRRALLAERSLVLSEVDAAVAKVPVDASELSRLVARLRKFEDQATARDLIAAEARIELARDRADRAFELFGAIAGQPGAAPAEQRLLARILLRRHESGGGDRTAAQAMLEQALACAEAAYGDGADPADLLVAWQAASRLSDDARSAQLAARLRQEHPESPAGRLVQLAETFQPEMGASPLELLREDFVVSPAELEAMRALALLQAGDMPQALASAEALLVRAPGLLAVRWTAALVFHACTIGYGAGSPERAGWKSRRDAQLDWLLERAPAADPRRDRWAQMRAAE